MAQRPFSRPGLQGAARERGDILPAAITGIFLLLAVFAAVIDLSGAALMKTAQENAVYTARQACTAPAFALQMKNSETPGADTAAHVFKSLRASGMEGVATVWFYEVPQEHTEEASRAIFVGIQAEQTFNTLVSRGFGISSIPVGSHCLLTEIPYSETKAWRPRASDNGIYRLEAQQEAPGFAYRALSSISEYPAEVQKALQAYQTGSPKQETEEKGQ